MRPNPSPRATAKIRVVGVGGAGCNAIDTMIGDGLGGVDFIAANTETQVFLTNRAPLKVQLGAGVTRGLGAGANPDVGRQAALESRAELERAFDGADMVFITAGMGGGTGTGGAPVVADIARGLGCLTVAVVTLPFPFEGKRRRRQADAGLQELRSVVDALIVIPNERLLGAFPPSTPMLEVFRRADGVLLEAVRGITEVIQNTGHINTDFADVRTVMQNSGVALMGSGTAAGQKAALRAMRLAIDSPLLEGSSIDGATGVLVNITGGPQLSLEAAAEALTLLQEAAAEDANIIFGTAIDPMLGDTVKVTLVATGSTGVASRPPPVALRPTTAPLGLRRLSP